MIRGSCSAVVQSEWYVVSTARTDPCTAEPTVPCQGFRLPPRCPPVTQWKALRLQVPFVRLSGSIVIPDLDGHSTPLGTAKLFQVRRLTHHSIGLSCVSTAASHPRIDAIRVSGRTAAIGSPLKPQHCQLSLPWPLLLLCTMRPPSLKPLRSLLSSLLLFVLLLNPIHCQKILQSGRAGPLHPPTDDFDLTAEQARLLFEEDSPPPALPTPSSLSSQLPSSQGDSPSLPSPPLPNVTSDRPSAPVSPLSHPSCPDDFGGVVRLLSALFSPASISHSGDWRVSLHISASDHALVTRVLRQKREEDVLDLITTGERFLHTATYTLSAPLWSGDAESSALAWILDAIQCKAVAAVEALHSTFLAPAGLSSSIAQSGVWLQLMVVGVSVIVGAILSSHLRPAGVSHPASVRPLAVAVPPPAQRRRLNGASRPPSMASSLWTGLLLLTLTLFIAGYVHHYHTLYIQQRARNRVLESHPPPGCFDSSPPSFYSFMASIPQYLTRASKDDACEKWLSALDGSSYPNPLVVLSSFLSVTILSPLPLVGDALGGFTRHFLEHHSVVMQAVMMGFLLLFLLGCVGLCMLLGQMCVVRIGGGGGRGGRRGRLGGRREQVLIEDVSDDEEEEEERRRTRPLRLKAARRKDDDKRVVVHHHKRHHSPHRMEEEEEADEEREEEGEEEEEERKDVGRRGQRSHEGVERSAVKEEEKRVKEEEGKEEEGKRALVPKASQGVEVKEGEGEAKVKVEPVKEERMPSSSPPPVAPLSSRPLDQRSVAMGVASTAPLQPQVQPPVDNLNARSVISYI